MSARFFSANREANSWKHRFKLPASQPASTTITHTRIKRRQILKASFWLLLLLFSLVKAECHSTLALTIFTWRKISRRFWLKQARSMCCSSSSSSWLTDKALSATGADWLQARGLVRSRSTDFCLTALDLAVPANLLLLLPANEINNQPPPPVMTLAN